MKFVQVHDERVSTRNKLRIGDARFIHNIYLRLRAIKLHQKLWFGDLGTIPNAKFPS